MRRYLLLILFAVIVAAPYVMRAALEASRRPDVQVPPGADELVIVTPHNPNIRREFRRAFVEWHQRKYGQPVQVIYLNPGGTGDVRRLLENKYAAHRDKQGNLPAEMPVDMHVVWGGGDFFFNEELKTLFQNAAAKPVSVLQPMTLAPETLTDVFRRRDLAGVRLLDGTKDVAGRPRPQWVGVCLSAFGIVYSPDLCRKLGVPSPTTWADLADPRLAGMVALADPTYSGSVAVAYMMVLQRAMADAEAEFLAGVQPTTQGVKQTPAYRAAIARGWKRGMSQLLLIAANARYFTDSASKVPFDVSSGDAAAGMAIDFYGRVIQEMVGGERCQYVSPASATAITPDPIAILHGVRGRQLELATRFVEFLLSAEGQRLWIVKAGAPGGPADQSLRRTPIRPDIYADRTNWTDDENPYEDAGNFNQRGEWMGLFGDTRPLWAAAWIDARDSLKDAYARILAHPDSARREALIARLCDLPIELSDVERLRAQRRQQDKRTLDLWRAQMRIEWANRFRAHYDAVGREAGR